MTKMPGSVMVSVPSFGELNVQFVRSLQMMHMPIHRGTVWHYPVNEPVADARERAAEVAIEAGCDYVLFRDYDTFAPPHGLNTLMARDADVIGGLYFSKQKPPWPLIFKDMRPTMAWKANEVVECDAIGMGFTLIKTDVFKRLSRPWFKTFHGEHPDGPNAQAKFSTTEDVHFCWKLYDELGIKPFCDTSVSCVHMDYATGTQYMYDPKHHVGMWVEKDGTTCSVPPVSSELCPINDQSTKGVEAK